MEFIITLALLINTSRSTPLVYNADLGVRAYHRAEYLCEHNQFSHAGWLKSFEGTKWVWVGENLVSGYPTGLTAHKTLMDSPSHRANILDKRFRALGIGTGWCGTTVELFGGN